MANLIELEIILRDIEEDIRETSEEIERQRDAVRSVDDPFRRKYAEHVLATYEHRRSETQLQQEQVWRDIATKKSSARK